MIGDYVVEFFLELLYLACLDLDVRSLSLHSAERLMYHDAAVGERGAFAFLAGHEKHGCHRCRHTCTHRRHVALDELHGVVYAETCGDASARRVDVDVDVERAVNRVEIEQLRLEHVGCIIVYFCSEEYDAVGHQS